MAIALSSSSDENNIAGTSSQISSEIKKGPSSEMLGGCSVCSDDQGTEENPLVYCDGCEVAVHQACYGIVNVPPGNWFCRKCECSDSQNKMKCELCPSKDGALKQTETGLWAHVVCALYIPEVRFGNNNTMEPIEIKHIKADRYNKSCYLCVESGDSSEATYGAVMDCHKLGCKQSFHVTCAQTAGLLFEEAGQGSDNVTYCGYCKHHFRKLKAGNRKYAANSLNNNTSSSYLDSASDSSQDNDSRCNISEQDKNSVNRTNNKPSTLPSNLSINDSPKSLTPSTPPLTTSSSSLSATTTTTTATATTNSNSSMQYSVTPSKTTDPMPNNTSSPISLTTPSKTNNSSSKKKTPESAASSPQKKKRAPRKVPSTPSSTTATSNTSTLLASTGSQNNSFCAQPSTAHFPNSYVNNSKPESNTSGDNRTNNLTTTPLNLFMNDSSPAKSTTSATTTTTTTSNSHSPVQTSVTPTKTTESKSNKNSSISLTIPPKSTSRSKKKAQESVVDSPQKKKRAPRKKPQGDSSSINTASNSSTLLTTAGSSTNSFGTQPLSTGPFPNAYGSNSRLDISVSNDHKNKTPVIMPSNLFPNDAPPLSASTSPPKATTNSHSPAQTSVSPSKAPDTKDTNNYNSSLSLTIPLKSTSRGKKKTPDSDSSPPSKKKRAPRKKAPGPSPTNATATNNTSTLLATTGSLNSSFGVPTPIIPFPTAYANNTKLEVNASADDVYSWSNAAASIEQNDFQLNNKNNNKKKPIVKDDPARAFEELRENTWTHLSRCILDQAQQFDIPSLIGTLYTLRSENEKLVNRVRDLTSKRDQLVAMNARLDLPGPMLTQHLNNTSPSFSSVVCGLANSPKGSPAPSPGSAINKQPLISVVGSYNHVPSGALGSHGFLDRNSPLMGQPHSGVNNIKSSQISTPSPPIGALMAHSTSNRTGLIAVNPPYMSNVFPPKNTIGQLGTNPQGSPYYPRQ